jgi:hypothetical protein
MVTLKPRACSSLANEADTIPLPNEEVTPPVTNIYLVIVKDHQKGDDKKLSEVAQSYQNFTA